MPLPRDLRVDAFFADEWSPLPVSNPRGVHFSCFTSPLAQPLTAVVNMQNPLDPSVGSGLIQPESQIPIANQGQTGEYCIFIPPALFTLAQATTPAFTVKISLLFCVGTEYNRHGLRTYLVGSSDRVLITVPGIEADTSTGNKAWGIGITPDMIDQLFNAAGTPSITNWVVDRIAGYSTGYRGVNGTVNNSLIALSGISRVVFYDALYWGDEPPAPPGAPPMPTPPGVSPPPAGSPVNTWRMLAALKAASPGIEIITYEVTEPGGTPRDGGMLRVDVPSAGLINLKPQTNVLTALILARVLSNGVSDGYFTLSSVPGPIATLIGTLPARGALASSPLTGPRASAGLLGAWGTVNSAAVAGANSSATTGLSLIASSSNLLMGWEVPSLGDMCHDGFLQEFAWEFLFD